MYVERVNRTFFLEGSVAGTCTQKLWELIARIQAAFLEILQTILPWFFEKEKSKEIHITRPPQSTPVQKETTPVLQLTQSDVESVQSQEAESEEEDIALSDAEDFEEVGELTDWKQIITKGTEDPEFREDFLRLYPDPEPKLPKKYKGHPPAREMNFGEVLKGNIQIGKALTPLEGSFVVHQALSHILYKFSENEDLLLSDELDDILRKGQHASKKQTEVMKQFPRLSVVRSKLFAQPTTKLDVLIAALQAIAKDHEDLIGGILYKGLPEDSHVFGIIIKRVMINRPGKIPLNQSLYYLIDPYGERISLHKLSGMGTLKHYFNSIYLRAPGESYWMTPVVFK